jgi:hypothetical protein
VGSARAARSVSSQLQLRGLENLTSQVANHKSSLKSQHSCQVGSLVNPCLLADYKNDVLVQGPEGGDVHGPQGLPLLLLVGHIGLASPRDHRQPGQPHHW